jgi:ABC-type branched-subunit amino acid transport system ATPase component
VILEKGHVVWTGTSAELIANAQIAERYLRL